MRMEEFAEEVLKGVEEKVGGSLEVRIVPGAKIMASRLQGLQHLNMREKGASVSIWIIIMRAIVMGG